MIKLPTPLIESASDVKATTKDLANEIMSRFQDARSARSEAEKVWEQSYRLWRNSSIDKEELRNDAVQNINTSARWRHKINTAKTFETVETLVAYLKAATFPSDEWFEVKALEPELGDIVDLVQLGVKWHLDKAKITFMFETFARHAIIFGFAIWKASWQEDVERVHKRMFDPTDLSYTDSIVNKSVSKLCIEAPSPFDVWVDSSAKGVWCRLALSRAEFLSYVESEYFSVTATSVKNYNPRVSSPRETQQLNGATVVPQEELIEFYGDVTVEGTVWKNVHAVFLGKELIRLGDSEYWCGSPYITMTTLPDITNVYGLSSLHPNLGMLHIDNVLTNFRLDNILLHMQGMWEKVTDGVLDEQEVVVEPGRIYNVANKGNLSRIDMGAANFNVSYNEQTFLEASIDRNMATGPLIGAGQPRRGDRVTAEEIIAVRDSGGNRLNSTHTSIEVQSTLPLLEKVFKLIQQFQTDELIVTRYNEEQKDTEFIALPPEVFSMPIELMPIGADFVIATSRNLSSLMQLLDIASRNEQMSSKIDYTEVLTEAMKQLRLPNPSRYLLKETPVAPSEPAPVDLSESVGGDIAQQAAQQMQVQDGGAEMLNALGVPTDGIDTAQLQGLMQNVTTNGNIPATV